MVTRAALALVLVAGCYADNLVPCGDLSCPVGMSCVADRCATPEQLMACANLDDGTVCSVENSVGVCNSGICDPTGCGNARLDALEQCDDGNTDYGDGCSGDCRSLETCGNGVVDFTLGEECDCGVDDATRPESCRLPNSDELEAECTPTCTLRFCGNGVLDRLEQCDDHDLGSATCRDFGYYGGELDCFGVCRYDTTSCTGRCGDQQVDPVYGEFCDGAPPEGTCITFGYDAGYFGCSTACTPDVERCETFGWEILDDARPRSLWARGADVVMIASDSSSAWITIDNVRDPAPAGTYRVATGVPGGDAYAIGDTTIAVWDGALWSTLAPGWTSGMPTSAWASATLGLYVAVGGTVWRYHGGTWTDENLTGTLGVTGDASRVVAWSASAVSESAGAGWTAVALPTFTGSITAYGTGTDARWLGVGTNQLHRETAGVWHAPVTVGTFTQLAVSTRGDLLLAPSLQRRFPDGSSGSSLYLSVTRLATSPFDEGVVAVDAARTRRLRTGAWSASSFSSDPDFMYDSEVLHIGPAGGKQLVAAGLAWYSAPGDGYFALVYPAPDLTSDFVEAIDGQLVFATPSFSDGLYVHDGIDFVQVAPGTFGRLRNTRSGVIVAGGFGVLASGGTPTAYDGWVTLNVPGYELRLADQLSDGSFVAVGKRFADGKFVLLTITADGTPTELANTERTTEWQDLWVAADDSLYAVHNTTLLVVEPGMPATMTSFPGAELQTVSGTTRDDVFVMGRTSTNQPFTGMSHFDGTAWTSVRVPAGNGDRGCLHTSAGSLGYISGRYFITLDRIARW